MEEVFGMGMEGYGVCGRVRACEAGAGGVRAATEQGEPLELHSSSV
jgi:hypothetical protein